MQIVKVILQPFMKNRIIRATVDFQQARTHARQVHFAHRLFIQQSP